MAENALEINGSSSGDGYGSSSGYGSGSGDGYGYGDGYGDGSGSGDGSGYGSSSGDGYGYGYGSGSGDGYGKLLSDYLLLVLNKLSSKWVLREPNAELRRMMIESMGADRLFSQLDSQIVHNDIDGCGNPRALVRIKIEDAETGYLQAVRVVCPTTGRVYFLGVPPNVTTCQEAVASTFNLKESEYAPKRET